MPEMKEVLKSNLCNYKDTCILVRGDIGIAGDIAAQAAFTNCVSFTKCITNIDGTTIHDAEDLDLVMQMYKLIEYTSNYSNKMGNSSTMDFNNNIGDDDNFKSFKYKTKSIVSTVDGILENAKIVVPLKYRSTFWRSHEMPLII